MAGKRRNNYANKSAEAEAPERRHQALELRKFGLSYSAIGERLGVTANTACRYVKKEIEAINKLNNESAEELRRMELERLDLAMSAIAPQVRKGNLGAVDRWLRISERRSKLLGLDATPRMNYLDMFKQLADDGMITQAQAEVMQVALAQFQERAIAVWQANNNDLN